MSIRLVSRMGLLELVIPDQLFSPSLFPMRKNRDSQAGLLSKMKRYDESLRAFDQALALIPASEAAKLAETWLLKGEALNKTGRDEEARQAYQNSIDNIDKMLQNDSNNSAAWYQKGRALLELARYDEALQAYELAISTTPSTSIWSHFPDAWIGKGDVLRAMDRNEEALQSYDRAIEINPIFGDAWRGRGEALNAFGKAYDASMSFYMALKLGYEEE